MHAGRQVRVTGRARGLLANESVRVLHLVEPEVVEVGRRARRIPARVLVAVSHRVRVLGLPSIQVLPVDRVVVAGALQVPRQQRLRRHHLGVGVAVDAVVVHEPPRQDRRPRGTAERRSDESLLELGAIFEPLERVGHHVHRVRALVIGDDEHHVRPQVHGLGLAGPVPVVGCRAQAAGRGEASAGARDRPVGIVIRVRHDVRHQGDPAGRPAHGRVGVVESVIARLPHAVLRVEVEAARG